MSKSGKVKKEGLRLLTGGRLERTRWVFEKGAKKGSYVTTDVTDRALGLLFEAVELPKGTRLVDLFLLAATDKDGFSRVFGQWSAEFVAEALSKKPKEFDKADKDAIERVEVYHVLSVEDGVLEGVSRANFHGVGVRQAQDYLGPDGTVHWKKGSRIPWSLSFSKAHEFAGLPLRIAKGTVLCMEDGSEISLPAPRITLGDLMHAVFWELSFYGPPKMRDKEAEKLKRASGKK